MQTREPHNEAGFSDQIPTAPRDTSGVRLPSVWSIRRDIVLEWLCAQPLVPLAVGLVAGIVLDAAGHWPLICALVLFAAAGVLLVTLRRRDGWCHLAVLLAAAAAGAALHDARFRHWPVDHLVRWCDREPVTVRLTGTIITAPAITAPSTGRVEWFPQTPRTRFTLAAEKIEGVNCDIGVSGLVDVAINEPTLQAVAGDRVELFGMIFRPVGPENPGELDFSLIGRRRAVLVRMVCNHAANATVVDPGAGRQRWMAEIRRRARAAMFDHTYRGQEPGAQLLAAMVLGQRSAVSPEVNDAFVATGTIHYLSVSGAHVAMLAFVVWIIGLLAGLTRRKCAVATMVVVTAYALLAEPNAPVWRSALLGNLLCISILLRRPTRSLNWLALAAIILLVIQPTQVFEPGFQLSFLTVIALLHLHPPLRQSVLRGWNHLLGRDDPLLMPAVQDMLNPPGQTRMVLRAFGRLLAEAVIVSFAAWLGSVLLAAHHFHRVPLWGWLDTVVALPLIWLAQILGFVKPVLSLLVPPLGHVFGPALAGLADGLIAVVVLLAKVPWSSVVTPAVPGWLVVAGFGVLGLWIVAERMQISRHVVAIAFLAFLVVAAWRLVPPGRGDSLRLQVLAIGHGAAQIMTLPNGKTMVVDCGSRPPFDLEQWTVGPALARNTIARIDAAIVSHAHLDHYSSIPDLAERRSVGCLMVSPHFLRRASQPGAADLFLREMRELDVPLRSLAGGDRLTGTGETVIDVLWPPADRDFAETNDESIVLRVTYAGWRILICGDIGAQPQEHLLASFDVRADVLVLPHHGTVDAMTDRFIREVNPRVCIRSSGQRDAGQSGGVAGLMSGRQYCSTADVGAVDVRISAQRIRILRGPHEQPTCSISR